MLEMGHWEAGIQNLNSEPQTPNRLTLPKQRQYSPFSMATPTLPYSRKNPFPAPLLVNRKLNQEGSEKERRHYEFSLAGSGMRYEVGDSMGVFSQNNPELVEDLLHALRRG
jgi:sulfite reductase alpha subunit-like flavoprotein